MANGSPAPDWQALDVDAYEAIAALRFAGTGNASPEVKGLAFQAGSYLFARQQNHKGVWIPTKTILGACTALGAGAAAFAATQWQRFTG